MQLKGIKKIIQNYLSGSEKVSERKAIENWLDTIIEKPLPHSDNELRDLRDTAWNYIEANISITSAPQLSPITIILRTIGAVAAVLLTGFVLFKMISNTGETQYMTGPNEHRVVMLHDGTKVHLAGNTVLSIDRDFRGGSNRRVNLHSGEAFFQVYRNEQRPFIVANEYMHTEVLGTSFRITSPANSNRWNIRVKTGKVRVSENGYIDRSYTLLAGDSLAYTKGANPLLYRLDSTTTVPLVFRDQQLQEVMETLASRYQRRIHVSESLAKKHQFSGEFDGRSSLMDILDIISLATGTHYHEKGDTIFVSNK